MAEQKEITKLAYEQIKTKLKEAEESLADTLKDIGQHGNDQDGWHSEAFQLTIINEMKTQSEIARLKKILHDAKVVEPEKQNKVIKVGNTAGLVIGDEPEVKYFRIDGVSVDLSEPQITTESPLGKVILGKKVGEIVGYQAVDGNIKVKVKEIKLPQDK